MFRALKEAVNARQHSYGFIAFKYGRIGGIEVRLIARVSRAGLAVSILKDG